LHSIWLVSRSRLCLNVYLFFRRELERETVVLHVGQSVFTRNLETTAEVTIFHGPDVDGGVLRVDPASGSIAWAGQQTVRIHDYRGDRVVFRLDGNIAAMAFSATPGRLVVVTQGNFQLHLVVFERSNLVWSKKAQILVVFVLVFQLKYLILFLFRSIMWASQRR